ncbi:hypothetical protein IU11_02145 [Cellulosimicrobium sp. MM]|nr:hypothetical protein IU11_02145 [Cellulosimicrobium sp. MM]
MSEPTRRSRRRTRTPARSRTTTTTTSASSRTLTTRPAPVTRTAGPPESPIASRIWLPRDVTAMPATAETRRNSASRKNPRRARARASTGLWPTSLTPNMVRTAPRRWYMNDTTEKSSTTPATTLVTLSPESSSSWSGRISPGWPSRAMSPGTSSLISPKTTSMSSSRPPRTRMKTV